MGCSDCVLRYNRLNITADSALKRHGYYCRSNAKPPVPRRRSCAACAKAKTSCDNAVPVCSRCIQKGFTCKYPSRLATKGREAVEMRRVIPNESFKANDNYENTIIPAVTERNKELPEIVVATEDPMLFTDLEWDFDDITNLGDVTNPTSQSTFASFGSSHPAVSADPTINSLHLNFQTISDRVVQEQPQLTRQRLQQYHNSPLWNVPVSPNPISNVRSMTHRTRGHPGMSKSVSLILYTLKSYPLMLRQNQLPPFIHPSHVSLSDKGETTEPLATCIALTHIMASGTQASRKLFWRNVRQECERICNQNQTFSKMELLGAMQALSIYVLIRLDEGETEHNNLDHLLERAFIVCPLPPSYQKECLMLSSSSQPKFHTTTSAAMIIT